MTSTDTTQGAGGLKPARRTIVKGAAWAVPAIAVAAPAASAAASQYVTIIHTGGACKLPGNSCNPLTKGYLIPVQICTNVRGTVTVDFSTVFGTLCGVEKAWAAQPDPLVIVGSPDGSEVCRTDIRFGVVDQDDSANCAIEGTGSFTWTSTNGLSGTGSVSFSSPTTPPCDHCAPPTVEPAVEEPAVADLTVEEPVVETTVEEPVVETQVEEPVTDEAPAPGADTESSTTSPQG